MSEATATAKRRKEVIPTLNANGVANLLDCSLVWVYELTRLGPEKGGIQGYVMAPSGDRWIPREPGKSSNRTNLMYNRDEVLAYKAKHPAPSERIQHVDFTSGEEQLMLDLAKPELEEKGYVTRRRVLNEAKAKSLEELGPYNIERKISDRFYPKLMAIAHKHQWPLPPRMPKNTAARRRAG